MITIKGRLSKCPLPNVEVCLFGTAINMYLELLHSVLTPVLMLCRCCWEQTVKCDRRGELVPLHRKVPYADWNDMHTNTVNMLQLSDKTHKLSGSSYKSSLQILIQCH